MQCASFLCCQPYPFCQSYRQQQSTFVSLGCADWTSAILYLYLKVSEAWLVWTGGTGSWWSPQPLCRPEGGWHWLLPVPWLCSCCNNWSHHSWWLHNSTHEFIWNSLVDHILSRWFIDIYFVRQDHPVHLPQFYWMFQPVHFKGTHLLW